MLPPRFERLKFWAGKGKGSQEVQVVEPSRKIPLLQDNMYRRLGHVLSEHGFFDTIVARVRSEADRQHVGDETVVFRRTVPSQDGYISHGIAFYAPRQQFAQIPMIEYAQEIRDSNHRFNERASYSTDATYSVGKAERSFCNFDVDHLVVNPQGSAAIAALISEMFPENLQTDLQIDGTYPYVAVALVLEPKGKTVRIQFLTEDHIDGNFMFGKELVLQENGLFNIITRVPVKPIKESKTQIAFNAIDFPALAAFLIEPIR